MDLAARIYEGEYSSLSLIGMAKNVGKTVALKYLLDVNYGFRQHIGITSVGRDGERVDILAGHKKPLIWVEEGALVASAAELLLKTHAKLEILDDTGVGCALGPVYLARVTRAGYVELAGPSTEEALRRVLALMRGEGASLIFVDGAFDRQVAASPATTDATIMSTGMALHTDIKTVLTRTACRVEQLSIPAADKTIKQRLGHLAGTTGAALVRQKGEIQILPFTSALGHEAAMAHAVREADDACALVVLGAVVNRTLQMFLKNQDVFKNIPLIIQNGAYIFVENDTWQRFVYNGGILLGLEPITVAAVTANPTSPTGRQVPAESFLQGLSRMLPRIPIYDLVAGKGALGGRFL